MLLYRLGNRLSHMGESLTGLFYPRLCPACSEVLYGNENILCLRCTCELPRTHFHLDPENDVARLFWGRVMIKDAASFFYYQKGSRYQHIIHAMKYHNRQQLGIDLGRWVIITALTIASIKTVLVLNIFMHLKFEDRTFRIFVGVAVLTLAIFIVLTFFDYAFH